MALAIGREFQSNVFLGDWELPSGASILGSIPRMEAGAGCAPWGGAEQ
jgi:hypothetical protein